MAENADKNTAKKVASIRLSSRVHGAVSQVLDDEVSSGVPRNQRRSFADVIDEWLPVVPPNQGSGQTEISVSPKDRRHQRELELLRYILEHGTEDDASWIAGNLKNFAEAIRSRKPSTPEPEQHFDLDIALTLDEERLVKEFRSGSLQKRRRMLASVFKMDEPLSPEAMPSTPTRAPAKRAGGKS